MHEESMSHQIGRLLEGYEALSYTVRIRTEEVSHPEMCFEPLVVLVVVVLILFGADVADEVLPLQVFLYIVLVEKRCCAELTVRVEERRISALVDVSLLHVPIESLGRVQSMLFQHTSFVFEADVAI